MTDAPTDAAVDRDVAVVGGGPAGCAAGVFTARYGLDTVVFDRGNASLRQCAHLENYLGFPGGIDVDTFYDLMYDHAETAGCDVVPELVECVERVEPAQWAGRDALAESGDRARPPAFALETASGRRATARRVVAATRYGGEYLRPLDGDAMFRSIDGADEGTVDERFDPDYADPDGRTPVDGLYVAAPAGERNAQAIVSAGHAATVARSVLADHRRERGYPDPVADHWDWLRRDSDRSDGWRDRWREWFDDRIPDDHEVDPRRLEALREADVERRADAYLSTEEIERRRERAHDRLLEHLDTERVLDHVDDDEIRAYLEASDVG